jgi:glycosyltransferase involved in cell wall biosynthesis
LIGYRITSYGFLASLIDFQPLIIAAQGQNIVYPENHLLKTIFAKYAIRKSTLIHAWAEHMANKIIKLGADKNKIFIKPKGIDIKRFANDNHERDLKAKLYFLSTRSLRKEYRIDVVLKAIKIIVNKGFYNFQLLLAGEGDFKPYLSNLAQKLKINKHVKFLGYINHDQLPYYYNQSTIYISTVPTDGTSGSLLEAMNCGCVPIVVDNEANRQWIDDGENGLLYKNSDSYHLADCIIKIINNKLSIERLISINRNIINEHANIHKNMKYFEDKYYKLLSF